MNVDDVRAESGKRFHEETLGVHFVQLRLGHGCAAIRRIKDRRVDDLVHPDAVSCPSPQPRPAQKGVVTADAEVADFVPSFDLGRHQIVQVLVNAGKGHRPETPSHV
jgi:hypothetical protein